MDLKHATIRKKLLAIIMGVTFATLITSYLVQTVSDYYSQRREVYAKLNITADLTARNTASALDFADQDAAQQNLTSLAYQESIISACLYDKAGNLFASYQKQPVKYLFSTHTHTACEPTGAGLSPDSGFNYIHLTYPITMNGAKLGVLFLDNDLTKLHTDFIWGEISVIFIMIISLLMAYLLASRLQKFITAPILALSNVAEKLIERQDYSIRAKKSSQDEIGILVDTFNSMIEGIEKRDKALIKAREEADNANQLKGQFLATMSHEIRTPMTGIIGMAELLLGSKLDMRQEGHARTIVSSGESLLNIINDILDFSKIDAGKLDLDPTAVDMLALVDDVGMLYSVKAREKAVELVVYYKMGTEQFVFADPVRVRQIIGNLVSNAIKFTDKGYILLSIGEDPNMPHRDDKVYLQIKVQDTGIGIPKKAQKNIFEKFSQADASTTRKFGGTGLGLAICKNLAELMGGSISFISQEGLGSTFTVNLPCRRNLTEAHTTPESASLKGTRIMIVDDLKVNLQLISEQLESVGAICGTANNGEDMLDKMHEAVSLGTPYQLAIIDYLMPEMNGEMVACAIKDDPALSECCLVMLTAAGNPIANEAYASKGFSASLSKPVQKDMLLESLAYIWSKYQQGQKNTLIRIDAQSLGQKQDDDDMILKGIKILMAEDNLVNQVFIEEIITDMQCDLVIVQNGKEALETLQKLKFDLVLMDCLMPVMDGFEASRTIRQLKEQGILPKDLPVIALTANAMKGDREKCLAAGMDDYLAKPIRKKELKDKLVHWLIDHNNEIKTDGSGETDLKNSILDPEALENVRKVLKGRYDSMVNIYLQDSENYINEITQALAANNLEAVIMPAHTLKSSSRQMGAMKLAETAKDIEQATKALLAGEQTPDQGIYFIRKSAEEIRATFTETRTAFEKAAA